MSPVDVALATVIALFPIANPIGAVAAFAALTSGQEPQQMHRTAWRTGLCVAGILAVFALVGTAVLNGLGITIPALQIAGGVVVAHSGFGMLSAKASLTDAEHGHAAAKDDISFSPMALPLVAGPGAIGVVIALAARHPGWASAAGVAVGAVVVGAIVAVALRYGTAAVNKLGPTGVGALSRIMGFLILTIGVELLIHGVQALR